MTERIKKQGKAAYFILAAVVFAIIGFIVYVVNSTTGYMAGKSVNGLIVVFTLAAIVGLAVTVVFANTLDNKLVDLLLVLSGALAIAGLSLFIMDRVSIIADIYFLPVNYPESEATTMNSALVGFGLYLLTIVMTAAAAFITRPGEAG